MNAIGKITHMKVSTKLGPKESKTSGYERLYFDISSMKELSFGGAKF
jgi:hypothetical protein